MEPENLYSPCLTICAHSEGGLASVSLRGLKRDVGGFLGQLFRAKHFGIYFRDTTKQ